MGLITRPMLAAAIDDIGAIKFPVLCTPKLDGIRCLIIDGKAVTRKFKPIPNHHIRKILSSYPEGFDGEIICHGKTFNDIQSLVMTEEGEPEFQYCVFDYVSDDLKKPYEERCEDLSAWYKAQTNPGIIELLLPQLVNSLTEFKQLEEQYIKQGYEGIILRSVGGPYKCNRSTLKEGYLLKLKRFLDSEAIIKGYEEKLHNDNIKETSELGLSKRSTKKANLRGADTLGALVVTDIITGLTFSVGSGFDDNMRKEIWSNQTKYVNKIVKYKYQPSGGKALPRFPVFLGFRSAIDM